MSTSTNDTAQALKRNYPGRETQIDRLINLFAQDDISGPPVLVVYGTEGTGKSTVVKAVFDHFSLPYALVDCKECVTIRHFFQKTYSSSENAAARVYGAKNHASHRDARPDTLNALAATLDKLVSTSGGRVVLLLDGVDKQREMTPTILAGIARMAQMISNLSVVMLATSFGARFLATMEPPALHFPAYSKEECVKILSLKPKSIFEIDDEDEYSAEMEEEDRWLWAQCCSAVWDSMGKSTARNVNELRDLVEELWAPLIQPIIDNEYGTRDFAKLFNRLKNEKLRNNEELYVSSKITARVSTTAPETINKTHDLPYYSKLLLCAAYLASHNATKLDSRYFSKLAEDKRSRKRVNKKKSTARQLNRKHLGARPFPMERMQAIFQSILHNRLNTSVDLGSQVATLASLRLISKVTNVSLATDASSKWRANIGYDYARSIGRSVKFELENHLEE